MVAAGAGPEDKRQFSLRSLLLFIFAVGLALGILRAVGPAWQIAFAIIGCLLLVCLVISSFMVEPGRRIGPRMLTGVSLPCIWLVWLGLRPDLYYMADVVFVIGLWLAVVVMYAVWATAAGNPRPESAQSLVFFAIPLVTTLLIAFRVPLRLGFLTAWPALSGMIASIGPDGVLPLNADRKCGLYTISASLPRTCHVPRRIYFVLADDPESAFIYSPNGIDHLCYNSGNKGHLFGNWYWMKED